MWIGKCGGEEYMVLEECWGMNLSLDKQCSMGIRGKYMSHGFSHCLL